MESVNKALHAVTDKLFGWLQAVIVSLPNLALAALIITAFWFLARWSYKLVSSIFKKTEFNRTLEHLLAASVKVLVLAIGAVLALSVLQLEKTVFSMLAGVGVIGLALGFAFQDLASNFISGIMIAVRAPMHVQDVIKIGEVTGTVVDLRLRDTVVRNFDGQHVYVPNKAFMSEKFANYSVYGKRKVLVTIGLGYEDDVEAATSLLANELSKIALLLKDPAVAVVADNFTDTAVVISAEGWIKYPGTDLGLAKHEMILVMKKALQKNGFTISYTTKTIQQGAVARESESAQRRRFAQA